MNLSKAAARHGLPLIRAKRLMVVLLVLFQAITVITFLTLSRIGTEAVMLQQAQQILNNATRQAVEHTGAFLDRADRSVSATARMFSSDVLNTGDPVRLESYFVSLLDQNEAFSGMYLGTVSGDFLYVSRGQSPDDAYRVKTIDRTAGHGAVSWMHDKTNQRFGHSSDLTDDYDPRARPWFRQSTESGRLTWTDPYIFFTAQKLGITAAAPVRDASGQLVGSVGIDLELEQLAGFLDRLDVGRSGSAFIANSEGVLIAAPFTDDEKRLAGTTVPTRQLMTIDTLKDIAGRQALLAIQEANHTPEANTETGFSFAGTEYLADHLPLELADGHRWLIGTFAERNDFLQAIRSNERKEIVLAAIVLAISMLLGWFLANSAWTPVEALHHQANRDQLTQLFNRHYLRRHAGRMFTDAAQSGTVISAVILDIDYFKRINDTHGHAVGDQVIKEFGHRLLSAARLGDTVARLGGEEFLLILPTAPVALADQITTRVAQWFKDEPIETDAGQLSVNFSAGIATQTDTICGYDQVLAAADKALYQAKAAGRDRVVAANTRVAVAFAQKKPRMSGASSCAVIENRSGVAAASEEA